MDEKPRMINDYEVRHAVQLAGAEVIFAVNTSAEMPYLVCDCSWNNPFGVDEYTNAVAGDDSVEMLREFTRESNLSFEKRRSKKQKDCGGQKDCV